MKTRKYAIRFFIVSSGCLAFIIIMFFFLEASELKIWYYWLMGSYFLLQTVASIIFIAAPTDDWYLSKEELRKSIDRANKEMKVWSKERAGLIETSIRLGNLYKKLEIEGKI